MSPPTSIPIGHLQCDILGLPILATFRRLFVKESQMYFSTGGMQHAYVGIDSGFRRLRGLIKWMPKLNRIREWDWYCTNVGWIRMQLNELAAEI